MSLLRAAEEPPKINIENTLLVGENDYGYRFGVGQVSGRWVGFATGGGGIFFLPGIEDEPYTLGMMDRDTVIKLTGAIAQDDEFGYGGIARWYVEENLRGNPEEFRCQSCESVGCRGNCIDDDFYDGDY